MNESPARTPETRERLLTADEVAEWLGIARNTLYVWRHEKKGPPSVKVGAALRWRASDVEGWLER